MSRYIRPHVSGATVFFSVALAARGGSLLRDHVADLRWAVARTCRERPFRIDAIVVLPDHLHTVWTLPVGDADFSTRWGAIKSRFTRRVREKCRVGFDPTYDRHMGGGVGWTPTLRRSFSKVRKGDAGLWQRRFWEHHIRDAADYDAHVRYCWMNPVKHGLVERAIDWPYSSIHRDLRAGRVAPDWSGDVPEGVFGEFR